MSTLRATNIKHESSATNQIVLGADGSIGGTLGDTLAAKLDASSYAPGLSHINTTSFSAVSSVSLDSVFSASYANYRVLFRLTAATANHQLQMRYRASSADDAGSNYTWNSHGVDAAGTTKSILTNAGTTNSLFYVAYTQAEAIKITLDILSPYAAVRTNAFGGGYGYASTSYSNVQPFTMGGQFTAATQFDGLSVIASAGTITGSISIYGYSEA